MPKLRNETVEGIIDHLCRATLEWDSTSKMLGLDVYILKYGVTHLLGQGRDEEAERRMLNLHFMVGYFHSYDTVVVPLMAWRYLGLNRARVGFENLLRELSIISKPSEDTIQDVCNLMRFLENAGLYTQGILLGEWALTMGSSLLGEFHTVTLETKRQLSWLYYQEGDYVKSEPLFADLHHVFKSQLGENDLRTVNALSYLASVYTKLNQFTKSESAQVKVVKLYEEELGPDHQLTLSAVQNLGFLYRAQGKFLEAEEIYVRVLAMRTSSFGPEDPQTVTTMVGLGTIYAELGCDEEAERLLQNGFKIRRRILGDDHPDTYVANHFLLQFYKDRERFDEAYSFFQRDLCVLRQMFGEDDPRTLAAINNWAWKHMEYIGPSAKSYFQTLRLFWTDESDWKYHWARLGEVFCESINNQDFSSISSIISALEDILGSEHSRVQKAKEYLVRLDGSRKSFEE